MNLKNIKKNIKSLELTEKKYLQLKFLIKNKAISKNIKFLAYLYLKELDIKPFKNFCFKTKNFKSVNKKYNLSRHILKSKYANGYLQGIRKGI